MTDTKTRTAYLLACMGCGKKAGLYLPDAPEGAKLPLDANGEYQKPLCPCGHGKYTVAR